MTGITHRYRCRHDESHALSISSANFLLVAYAVLNLVSPESVQRKTELCWQNSGQTKTRHSVARHIRNRTAHENNIPIIVQKTIARGGPRHLSDLLGLGG